MARTTIDELLARARASLERLEPEEALGAQRNGALLVDVRSDGERARHGVDPGSPHRNPDACDLRRHVVVVCADGYSSSLAAATLQELGYRRATDLVGGFNAWKSRGLPVAPAPVADDGPSGMGAVLAVT